MLKVLKFMNRKMIATKEHGIHCNKYWECKFCFALEGAVRIVRCMRHQIISYNKANLHIDLEQCDRDTRIFEIQSTDIVKVTVSWLSQYWSNHNEINSINNV